MNTSQYEETDLTLKNASLEKIAATASAVIYRNKQKKKNLSIKDVSGNSGAKMFSYHSKIRYQNFTRDY